MEGNEDTQKAAVFQYFLTDSFISPQDSMTLVVCHGRALLPIPSRETYAGSCGRWATFVAEVRELEWVSWKESLDSRGGLQVPVALALLPCPLCVGKYKIAHLRVVAGRVHQVKKMMRTSNGGKRRFIGFISLRRAYAMKIRWAFRHQVMYLGRSEKARNIGRTATSKIAPFP